MTEDHDNPNAGKHLAVLGGGPGGYPAAFLAADAGFEVTLIDKEANPGGVCLYRGCIPSKTLLHAAKLIHETRDAKAMGLKFGEPEIDLDKLRKYSSKVIRKMTGGLASMAKTRKVKMIQGTGHFTDPHTIEVAKEDGSTEQVNFDYAIVSTGSRPTQIPGFPHDSDRVMDSTDALRLDDVPENLLVVGGGYIGLELSTVYAALGSKVTVVEALDSLLAAADPDLTEHLNKRLKKMLHDILISTKVSEMKAGKNDVTVKFIGMDGNEERTFDKVLIAVGRRPNSADIGLEEIGVKVGERGFVEVNKQRRTNLDHIYAIGDVAGEPMLAHKATYEAKIAIQDLVGQPTEYAPIAIPAVVFTDPEVAWVGITENEAKERGIDHRVLRFPWVASGRASTIDRNDGLTKMVIDEHTGRLIGVGIVGVHAGELIAEATLAIETAALASDVNMTIHAHPTLSETFMEAAEMIHGSSPHYIPRS